MRRILLPTTIALALCLAGCATPEPPEPGPLTDSSAQPSTPAPRELSDEEALTIAVETYEAYMALGATVLMQGHDDERILDSVTTGIMLERNAGTRALAAEDDWQITGAIRISERNLVSTSQAQDVTVIVADVCSDQSDVEIRHGDGSPLDSRQPNRVLPIRLTVESSAAGNKLADMSDSDAQLTCDA